MTARRRASQRRSALVPIFVIGLILACLAVAGVSVALVSVTHQAETLFGPPAEQLTTLQRLSYSIQLVTQSEKLTTPADPGGKPRAFRIDLGEPTGLIADSLEQNGLIPSAEAFRIYLVYTGQDTGLQAGNFQLSPALTAVEIARKLQDATPSDIAFNILPGWRIEEIAAALPTSGLSITPQDFIQAARSTATNHSIPGFPAQASTLEGFLLPGSYTLKRDVTAEGMLNTFLQAFTQQVSPDLQAGFKAQHLSLFEAVTLASMVQKEAVVTDEQPVIASVFLNRLAAGMKLDSDPTVQYALGYNDAQQSWWTNPLSSADLQVESPYNTYLNTGLPPGPISNPALSVLKAVAFPAQTQYYYFRARCDGSGRHQFAATLEEQLKNACP